LKATAYGIYDDTAFFSDPMSPEGYMRRLAACTQNILIKFANNLRLKGHAEEIVDVVTQNDGHDQPRQVLRADALQNIHTLMQRSRGAELPGVVSTQLVGELFQRQAVPWKQMLEFCAKEILKAVYAVVSSIIFHVADARTADEVLQHVLLPALLSLEIDLMTEIGENLANHEGKLLVSYDQQFIDNMQRAGQESRKRSLSEKLHNYFKVASGTHQASGHIRRTVSITGLLEELCSDGNDAGVEYTCGYALDCMQVYYKVCLSQSLGSYLACRINLLTIFRSPCNCCSMTLVQTPSAASFESFLRYSRQTRSYSFATLRSRALQWKVRNRRHFELRLPQE
jgi:hypothetical protein